MTASGSFAFISQGRLFIKQGDGPARLVESRFAQEMSDREARSRQRNQWKAKSAGWNVRADGGMGLPGMFGGMTEPETRRVNITAVARCPAPGEVLYVLDTDTVGGMFHYVIKDDDERRLVHHHEFRIRDLHRHPDQPTVACSVRHEDGTASIAVTKADSGKLRHLTEGDSVDESPAWVPGEGERIVFQSAGVGRDSHGHVVGFSPYRIEMLDLTRERMTTLLESDSHDYLLPRMSADGVLHFIRRPYYAHGRPPVSPGKMLLDVVLIPWRILQTLGAYLNFTSMIYRGKPLSSAGGPRQEGPELRTMMLWGRYVDARKLQKQSNDGSGGLVGSDWELVRRDPDGSERVLARSVLSYDLTPEGDILHTDGSRIHRLAPDGSSTVICKERMIERVVAIA